MDAVGMKTYVPVVYGQHGNQFLQGLRTLHPDYIFEPPTNLVEPQHLEAMVATTLSSLEIYYIREMIICQRDNTGLFRQETCNPTERSPYDFVIFVRNLGGEIIPAIIEVDGGHHFRPKKDVRINLIKLYETYGSYVFFMSDNIDSSGNYKYYLPSNQELTNYRLFNNSINSNFRDSWLNEIKRLNNQFRNDRRKSFIPLQLNIPFLRISSMDVGANYSLIPKILNIFIEYLRYSYIGQSIVVYSSIEQYLHLVPNKEEYLSSFTTIKEMKNKLLYWKQIGQPMFINNNHNTDRMDIDIEYDWFSRYPTTNTQVTEARLFNEIIIGNDTITIPKI